MEGDYGELDLVGWVLVDDEFLDQHVEVLLLGMNLDAKGVMHENHFKCPSSPRRHLKTLENSVIPSDSNQLVSVPVLLELPEEKNPDHGFVKENREALILETSAVTPFAVKNPASPKLDADHAKNSKVFKKIESRFLDMEIDLTESLRRELETQMELASVQIEDEEEAYNDENFEHDVSKMAREDEKGKHCKGSDTERGCSECGGLAIWRWKANGIRAVSFIGAATAASVLLFIFCKHRKLNEQHEQNHNLQFQIHDKKVH
ncbi:hypothetical protein AAC387_Pa02g2941 [Persea americana]